MIDFGANAEGIGEIALTYRRAQRRRVFEGVESEQRRGRKCWIDVERAAGSGLTVCHFRSFLADPLIPTWRYELSVAAESHVRR